ncbi:unnamed protein product [Heterosigma akashiwo]|mmetsp:Transcript_17789/g.31374  ORF Transcript_17789/g.31374 Transcript_17789/m.31374 type:complete len:256 (-) Transcript_17789:197-964(-)
MAPQNEKSGVVPLAQTAPKSSVYGMKKISSLKDLQEMMKEWEPKRLAQIHDDINLVALGIISLVSIVCCLDMKNIWLAKALTYMALVYIAFDTIWITLFRQSVKSPSTVLGHHVAVLVVLLDPILVPVHRAYTAAALIVEVNTTLLILRRRVDLGLLLEVPFALSWVAIRLIWYPVFSVYLALCAFPNSLSKVYPEWIVAKRIEIEQNSPVEFMKASMVMWVGICLFQMWWSIPLIKTWFRQISGAQVPKANKFL